MKMEQTEGDASGASTRPSAPSHRQCGVFVGRAVSAPFESVVLWVGVPRPKGLRNPRRSARRGRAISSRAMGVSRRLTAK